MTMEEYKELIFLLVQSSYDIDYIIAVYSFAVSYPDKTRECNKKCGNDRFDHLHIFLYKTIHLLHRSKHLEVLG